MTEEEKALSGVLFTPGTESLMKMKKRAHILSHKFNMLDEDDGEERSRIIQELFKKVGEGCSILGPIYIHYGRHTSLGSHFFATFNLTIQDDAEVVIGDHCNFGAGTTIVTPVHPMLPQERRLIQDSEGISRHMCYALPVHIGNDCWFGANVTVCSGVTIGDGCVIGAGSVVTHDIPANSFAAGNPCRVIRALTEKDSMKYKPEVLGDNRIV